MSVLTIIANIIKQTTEFGLKTGSAKKEFRSRNLVIIKIICVTFERN